MWRKVVWGICGIVLLTGCSMHNTVSVEIIPQEYETESEVVRVERLEIKIPDAADFSQSINDSLNSEFDEEILGFEEDCAQSSEGSRMGQKSSLSITQDVKYNRNGFLSINEEKYVYTGGAHGMTLRKSRNIDIILQKEIQLSDLFAEEGYENTLNRMIKEQQQLNPDLYAELWERPVIKTEHQKNFYITDNALVIYYQPYELSYYAKGVVEFSLPLSELKGYMKEEYYRFVDI